MDQFDFDQVDLVDVSRHFGRRRAVTRVTLTVRRGDILGLLGPNGAGKSTLIGMLATLVTPTSGRIEYGERSSLHAGPDIRRCIGLLAHELHLYPELSARQNLDFFARLYGLDAHAVVPAALDAAGLVDRADDEVSAYSRGMRQRLALERSLLHRPRLVLLDEPFTGLDDQAVATISDRLRRLAGEGTIVVLATHALDLADGLVTRVAVIHSGRLVSDEAAGTGLRARYRALVGSA
jgi:ABC-type multidrug transport system ATPase subunit